MRFEVAENKKCPKCGMLHSKKGTFCSRHCSNSRTWSEADKLKKSKAAKTSEKVKFANIKFASKGKPRVKRLTIVCKACQKEFQVTPAKRNKQYCSAKCRYSEFGGYNEGSGRSYSGHYKGIYCASTYELCWVIYHLDHNILFKRFEGCLQRNGVRYFPDFIIDNTIYEIKGYYTDSVDVKANLARSYGYEIQVLYKQDLQHIFDYVKSTYNTEQYETLYDQYTPKYDYVCSCCGKLFSKNRKLKTQTVYCSRNCAGKGNKNKARTAEMRLKISTTLKKRYLEGTLTSPIRGVKRKRVQCPHCNRFIDNANFSRWHGEKCKKKGILNE